MVKKMDGCFLYMDAPPTISVRVSRNTLTSIFPYARMYAYQPPVRTCVCMRTSTPLRVYVCVPRRTLPYARMRVSLYPKKKVSLRDTSGICRALTPLPVDKLLHYMV